METTHEMDDDRRVPVKVVVDDTALREALEKFDRLLAEEAVDQEEQAAELVRLSRRLCWRTFDEAEDSPQVVTVGGQEWRLWLDRVETVHRADDGEPFDWFAIDRGED